MGVWSAALGLRTLCSAVDSGRLGPTVQEGGAERGLLAGTGARIPQVKLDDVGACPCWPVGWRAGIREIGSK